MLIYFNGNCLYILCVYSDKVSLYEENSKHAQFMVSPRYKVKAEGDAVSTILFLLIKTPMNSGNICYSS